MSHAVLSVGSIKKFKPKPAINVQALLVWASFFVVVGFIMLIGLRAAPALVVDSSLSRPSNVQAFGDDRVITVTWNNASGSNIVGYYVTYKKKGAAVVEGVKQTTYNAVQIQPVENGQEYEITVQSARGTTAEYPSGSLAHNANRPVNQFARGDGTVSTAVSVSSTPSSARVDTMRQRLTGFFDDFNVPANPLDELKWNVASTACLDKKSFGAFINAQYHAHNMGRSTCDRGGQASRPRANFDMSSATEANPAQIEFDIDGASYGRDTWYLDIIPLDARKTNLPLDITSHNDLFDADTEDPGNMLRINSNGSVRVAYYDSNRNPRHLDINTSQTACDGWWEGPTTARFDSCDMSKKTLNQNPLPEPSLSLSPTIPNVRRHWVVRMTPTKLRVYIDSVLVADANLPAEFAAKKVYTLHSTIFTYNTGKDFNPSWSNITTYPTVEMIHWDNFGFTGPASNTVIHNYIDGGADGKTPVVGRDNTVSGQHTTIIPVPDPIGNIREDKANLYLTIQNFGWQSYTWSSSHHILFNGKRYNLPDPRTVMNNPKSGPLAEAYVPYPATITIDKADIRQGNNVVTFNIPTDIMNIHLELPYARSDTNRPNYTQPINIFGQVYSDLVEPAMTNCDSYNYVEEDLGLPFPNGKANLQIGSCSFLSTIAHHNPGATGHVDPVPAPDTTRPTVTLTAPENNTQVPGNSVNVSAQASDNVGVQRVEFYLSGIRQATVSNAPYNAAITTSSLAPGAYPLYAVAYDAAGNVGQSSSVNIVRPVPTDTTRPTVTLTSPTANASITAAAITATATAADNVGVAKVEFYIDNELRASVSTAPYTTSISRTGLNPGNHTIYARAYDAAGNTRDSSIITFSIPTPTCPTGQTGTPPNCVTPPTTCPTGQTGTPPNCVTPIPTPTPTPTPTPNKTGDLNGDGKVDIIDVLILLSNYGKRVTKNTGGDINGDARVTILDLLLLLNNYMK